MLSRRDFAKGSLGLLGSTMFVGCATAPKRDPKEPLPAARPTPRYLPATDHRFEA